MYHLILKIIKKVMKTIFNSIFIIVIFLLSTSFKTLPNDFGINTLKLTKITDGLDVTNFIYENDLLVKTISTNPNNNYSSVSEYFYENGKVKKRSFYDLLSTGLKKNLISINYIYTENLITSDINNVEGINYYNVYSYDNFGVLLNRKESDSNGNLINIYNYEYYGDGNLKQELKLSGNESQITEFLSYDLKNNPAKLFMPFQLIVIDLISNNNLLSFGETTFEYEYNELNYPIKIIEKENDVIISTKILEFN